MAANKKIWQFPENTSPSGGNLFVTDNNFQTQKLTLSGLTNYISGNLKSDPFNGELSGSSITWNVGGVSKNYQVILDQNMTVNLINVNNGDEGTLIITQDLSGGYGLVLGTVNGQSITHKVAGNGNGTIVLTAPPGSVDIATFKFNGSVMFWDVDLNYT